MGALALQFVAMFTDPPPSCLCALVCAGTGEFVAAFLEWPVYGALNSEPEGCR